MATDPNVKAMTEATLSASRAILGSVARSLADALEQVTLPQFRVLVILSTHGPQRTGDLAGRLGVHQSTFSRTGDRLVKGGWVRRIDNPDSRREIYLELTETGRELVTTVNQRRRKELQLILRSVPEEQRAQITQAMIAFAQYAGEPPEAELLTLGLQ